MPDTQALIGDLTRDLRPIRRLRPPMLRAALWLVASLWFAALLALFANVPDLTARLTATPDMGLAFAGAVLTTVAAALATFESTIPGRSPGWALLPLPPLALWVGASGAGCLRPEAAALTRPEGPMHAMTCMYFILLLSVPLAALLAWLVMRAYPLRPALTASLAGLASAAAAASLLTMVHPYDATATDLLAHAAAVALVVLAARTLLPRRIRRAPQL